MKRGIFLLVFLLVVARFVVAQSDVNLSDANNLKDKIANYTPIDEEGNFNTSKIDNRFQTRAEKRIKKINEWLDRNVAWLKLAFGMKPEISWLFIFNMYFWLLAFVALVMNAKIIFSLKSKAVSRLLGFLIFVMLLVVKIYYYMGKLVYGVLHSIFLSITSSWIIVSAGILICAVIIMILTSKGIDTLLKKLGGNKTKRLQQALEENVEQIEAMNEAMRMGGGGP